MTDRLRDGLARSALRIRRRRWTGIGTALALCLAGWTGTLLLPEHPIAPPGVREAATDPGASGAAGEESRLAAEILRSRRRAASLRADLKAVTALRAVYAAQIAETPRLLDDLPNPVHRQRSVQLDQQDALIASLQLRLAELRADFRKPGQRRAAPAGMTNALNGSRAGGAIPPSIVIDPTGTERADPDAGPSPRSALLGGILAFRRLCRSRGRVLGRPAGWDH